MPLMQKASKGILPAIEEWLAGKPFEVERTLDNNKRAHGPQTKMTPQ